MLVVLLFLSMKCYLLRSLTCSDPLCRAEISHQFGYLLSLTDHADATVRQYARTLTTLAPRYGAVHNGWICDVCERNPIVVRQLTN